MADAKRKSRTEAKREEILAAASHVFREEGYDTTSMDRIAERADASKRTVYNHFGSKEALFEAVVAGLLESMHAAKQVAWDPDRPLADQLGEFARAKGAISDDEASMALMRVVLGVAIHRPDFVARVQQKFESEEDALVRWLRDADAAGALSVPDPALAAELFWAMAAGALFWPAVIGAPIRPNRRDALVAELVETFLARYRR
ncbi:MAG: TetR/AcrR family transcriptional regulator [Planctomycetota bacterium]